MTTLQVNMKLARWLAKAANRGRRPMSIHIHAYNKRIIIRPDIAFATDGYRIHACPTSDLIGMEITGCLSISIPDVRKSKGNTVAMEATLESDKLPKPETFLPDSQLMNWRDYSKRTEYTITPNGDMVVTEDAAPSIEKMTPGKRMVIVTVKKQDDGRVMFEAKHLKDAGTGQRNLFIVTAICSFTRNAPTLHYSPAALIF